MAATMATASPEKRRVLGILDANRPSPTFRKQLLPGGKLAPVSVASERLRAVVEQPQLPLKRATVPDLRSEGDGTMLPPTKKQRSSEPVADGLDGHEVEPQTRHSPAHDSAASSSSPALSSSASSADDSDRDSVVSAATSASPSGGRHSSRLPTIFDASEVRDQDTGITEPDHTVPQPSMFAARRPLTREEARQKAETLRLRLLLANYKVRTGQTDVPLEQLRVVPVPGPHYRHTDPLAPAATTTTTTLPPPSSMVATAGSFSSTSATSSTHSDATETCRQLAPPAPSDLSATPRDGEDDALHKDEQPGKTVPEGNDLPPLYHQPARTPVRRRSGGAYSDSDSDGEEGDDYARWRRARLGNDVEQRRGEAYPRHNHEDDIANSELRGGAVASLLSLKRGAAVVD